MCVRSTTLYGGETWYLREVEIANERTDKAMIKEMCSLKLRKGVAKNLWL